MSRKTLFWELIVKNIGLLCLMVGMKPTNSLVDFALQLLNENLS